MVAFANSVLQTTLAVTVSCLRIKHLHKTVRRTRSLAKFMVCRERVSSTLNASLLQLKRSTPAGHFPNCWPTELFRSSRAGLLLRMRRAVRSDSESGGWSLRKLSAYFPDRARKWWWLTASKAWCLKYQIRTQDACCVLLHCSARIESLLVSKMVHGTASLAKRRFHGLMRPMKLKSSVRMTSKALSGKFTQSGARNRSQLCTRFSSLCTRGVRNFNLVYGNCSEKS